MLQPLAHEIDRVNAFLAYDIALASVHYFMADSDAGEKELIGSTTVAKLEARSSVGKFVTCFS